MNILEAKEALSTALLKAMTGFLMRIHLRDEVQLFATYTPRVVPLAFRGAVKQELDSMVTQGVIAPAGDDPSPCCHL